jgi:hypothetical protein
MLMLQTKGMSKLMEDGPKLPLGEGALGSRTSKVHRMPIFELLPKFLPFRIRHTLKTLVYLCHGR